MRKKKMRKKKRRKKKMLMRKDRSEQRKLESVMGILSLLEEEQFLTYSSTYMAALLRQREWTQVISGVIVRLLGNASWKQKCR